jgi:hypothetical protein
MGAIIRVDNVTSIIDHGADAIYASAGSVTNIALGRENKFTMKSPYSDCILDNDVTTPFDSDIYNSILASKFSYNQQFCMIKCAQKLVIKECGCSFPYFESVYTSVSVCTNVSVIFDCGLQQNLFGIYLKNDYINKFCIPLCPLECNSTKFTFTTSTFKLLGQPYVDIIQNNPRLVVDYVTQQINANTASDSVAKINIFYDSLSYVINEESPALDIITLVANMGGSWGLFISVNLFSIAEIVTALIEIFYYKRGKKNKNSFE